MLFCLKIILTFVTMKTAKIITTPIQLVGHKEKEYKLVEVKIELDVMREPNLVSVRNFITKVELLPLMDSVSKQVALHKFFSKPICA